MLKRSLVLILSLLLVLGLISCKAQGDERLLKIADAKGFDVTNEDDTEDGGEESTSVNIADSDIILNTSSKKIHLSSECGYCASIKEKNKLVTSGSELSQYLENGYTICSNCNKKYGEGN